MGLEDGSSWYLRLIFLIASTALTPLVIVAERLLNTSSVPVTATRTNPNRPITTELRPMWDFRGNSPLDRENDYIGVIQSGNEGCPD
jgi:hypothetical protein